jgi:surface-anchored protein
MRINILLPLLAIGLAGWAFPAQSSLPSLITEHADIRVNYTASGTNGLSLVVRDADASADYQTNEIVLVALETSKVMLPPGTPFGDGGDPLWVLPQSRAPGQTVLFLGFAAGGAGVFSEPLTVQLKNVEGPGRFFLWQSDEFGGLQIKMDSTDGIDAADKVEILPAGHDHYNWGFTTSGVYCVTFQASGTPIGEVNPIVSAEATFVFHVRPLGVVTPFSLWQKAHWLQGTDESISGPGADPDNDGLNNALEYASHLDPNLFSTSGRPEFSWTTDGPERYGAFTFTRVKAASDLSYDPAARTDLNGGLWETMAHEISILDDGFTERVTVRDSAPMSASPSRFYQFRVMLTEP